MTAQLEEVVAHPDLPDLEHLGPDRRQGLLQLTARSEEVLTLLSSEINAWQRLAVELAVGIERQLLEPGPVQRDHVLGQLGTQALLDQLEQHAAIGCRITGHQITHQMLAIDPFLNPHRGVAHLGLLMQTRFDLAQFDTVATDLHLMVNAPDVFEHAIRTAPRQVTRAVQAFARRPERMRDERQGGALRGADIAATDAGAGHTELTDGPQWHQLLIVTEQVQAVVVGRRTNGQIAATGRGRIDTEERHVIGTFRRTIGIDQADLRIALQPLRRQLGWHRLPGWQHPAQAVELLMLVGEHALDQ
ncbi:hypothetical protein D3C76_1099950 [compost metagenome]